MFNKISNGRMSAGKAALGVITAGLALLGTTSNAGAQSPQENKAIVTASFDAWKAGTGSPFDLLANDAIWTIEGRSAASATYPGKEAFLSDVIRPFNARMAVGIKPAVRSMTAEEDRVVILFDAAGTARDGITYANSYAWFFRMEDGRVVEANAFFDAVAFNDLWSRVAPAAD
ncbi:nuclear transport factor 2 family protein [Sphingopyxis sp. Root1497]|uniref:nuclear transport factor 2 family protein n=1 Tax=Sphingopyxis sp. Root1497 TaxID=1736474 RepID=UPI000B018314|nr:nuclear transport factor 2 family protein [Sphingopyxis sp. Root1497]